MASPARKTVRSDPAAAHHPAPIGETDEMCDLEVPAAVVCAMCGAADCPGCGSELSRSGVVTVVAWERPGGRAAPKLWETAHAATRDAEAFFELLPDGPIAPALRFAFACELLASAASIVVFLAIAAALAPSWVKHVALDATARDLAFRIFAMSVPSLAVLLVVAHAAHGLSLDVGAKKNGGRPAASRALRFGLYATGWDLVQGPIGALVIGIKSGFGAWVRLHTAGVPTRASRAFLRGCYRLGGRAAEAALGTSYVGAIVVTLISAFVIIAAALVGVLLI